MSRLLTAVKSYQSNNQGSIPASFSSILIPNYLESSGDTFIDPDGSRYIVAWGTVGTIPNVMKDSTGRTMIYRFTSAKCDGENTISTNGSNRIALSIKLEGGGIYCVNN